MTIADVGKEMKSIVYCFCFQSTCTALCARDVRALSRLKPFGCVTCWHASAAIDLTLSKLAAFHVAHTCGSLMKLFHHVSVELQSEQITELLRIIEHQSNHLEQYRAVLDTQRESNINLNADCERIQAR